MRRDHSGKGGMYRRRTTARMQRAIASIADVRRGRFQIRSSAKTCRYTRNTPRPPIQIPSAILASEARPTPETNSPLHRQTAGNASHDRKAVPLRCRRAYSQAGILSTAGTMMSTLKRNIIVVDHCGDDHGTVRCFQEWKRGAHQRFDEAHASLSGLTAYRTDRQRHECGNEDADQPTNAASV